MTLDKSEEKLVCLFIETVLCWLLCLVRWMSEAEHFLELICNNPTIEMEFLSLVNHPHFDKILKWSASIANPR